MAERTDIYIPNTATVELLGKKYRWEEPVRRQRRLMQADLLDISALITEAGEGAVRQGAATYRAVVKILDFFKDHHPLMAVDYEKFWAALDGDDLDEADIIGEFKNVWELVMRPLLGAGTSPSAPSSEPKQPEAASTS